MIEQEQKDQEISLQTFNMSNFLVNYSADFWNVNEFTGNGKQLIIECLTVS
ncbi:MAG: hypothetical protein AABX46_00615 [Thermoproteota archaeon]